MHPRESFYRRQRRKQRLELGLQPSSLSLFSFVGFVVFPDYRTFTEDSAGNEGWSWVLQPLRYLRFLLWIFFSSPLQNFYRRQRSKQRFELGLQHFVIFASFCLVFSAALLRIGWEIEREFRWSDRILSRPSWSDVVFAFYDAEEIGPRMPCADCKENRV